MFRKNPGSALPATASAALLSITPAVLQAAPAAAQATALETIVITAERIRDQIETQRTLTPGAVSVVDGADLFRREVSNLADLLRYVPGVWAESSSGSDELFFSSRGSNLDATDYDKNGIKLMQDGLPVTTADGNNHNRVIDPLSARYAVIAHGANALTYGASTLGGAIDFTSPTARNSAPLTAYVNGGSHGLLVGRLTAGGAGETADGLVTVEGKRWDGYRDHNTQERYGLYANAGWVHSPQVATRVYATYVHNDEELPGALTGDEVRADPDQASVAAIGGHYQKNVETARIAAKTTWHIDSNSTFEAGLSYEDQSLYHPIVDRVLVDFDGTGPEPPVEVFSLLVDTDHRDVGATAALSPEGGRARPARRSQLRRWPRRGRQLSQRRRAAQRPDRARRQPGGQSRGVSRRPVALRRRLDTGLRWTARRCGSRREDHGRCHRQRSQPEGRLLVVQPARGAHLHVERAQRGVRQRRAGCTSRPPRSRWKTMFAATTPRSMPCTARSTSWACARRRPRSTRSAGGGISPRTTRRSATRSCQWMTRPRRVTASPPTSTGRHTRASRPWSERASRSPGSDRHRIEPLVSLTVNAFSFDSDPVYGNNDLPAAPAYAARGEVMYRNAGGLYAGPTFDLVGRRYADFANTYRVDSYGLLGLRGGYAGKNWELFGEVRNLLDENYIATLSVLNVASPDARVLYPGAPVSAYVGLRMEF